MKRRYTTMVTTNRALERFLREFPDDATSWKDATDELPDMYVWIAERLDLPPVGRSNCRTPSEWNRKYKAAIRRGYKMLDTRQRREFAERFAEWFKWAASRPKKR